MRARASEAGAPARASAWGAARGRGGELPTCPHSVHSLSAASIFCSVDVLIWKTFSPISEVSEISASEATAFETTIGFE